MYNWVLFHRVHHKYTDTEADPYNAKRGFFFAHIGWVTMDWTPEFRRAMKEIDMSDIDKDPLARFNTRLMLSSLNT